jgi:hypothetical protein
VNFHLPGRFGSLMHDHAQVIVEWERVLDRIELDLQLTLSSAHDPLAGPLEIWDPPADLPPMPAEVADRVRRLLEQQGELLLQLESSRRKVRRHLQYLDANAAKGMTSGPLFIDTQS